MNEEDLSRLDGPTKRSGSKRLAAHRKRKSSAQIGLERALARHRVPDLTEIPANELAGLLTGEQRAELAASLPKPRRKMSHQDERVFTVAQAVKNDPHCAYNANIGMQLIADDDFAALTGEAIVKHMKAGPKPPPPPTAEELQERMEAVQREVMLAAIFETPNSNIDPTGGGSAPAATFASGWAKATDAVNRASGLNK